MPWRCKLPLETSREIELKWERSSGMDLLDKSRIRFFWNWSNSCLDGAGLWCRRTCRAVRSGLRSKDSGDTQYHLSNTGYTPGSNGSNRNYLSFANTLFLPKLDFLLYKLYVLDNSCTIWLFLWQNIYPEGIYNILCYSSKFLQFCITWSIHLCYKQVYSSVFRGWRSP